MGDQITFISNNVHFIIDINKIPKHCTLYEMINDELLNKNSNNIITLDYMFTNVDFNIVYNYLMYKKLPSYDQLYVLDLFGISELDSYELATLRENYMRKNMYKEEFKNSEININEHYGLQKITKHYWNNLNLLNYNKIKEDSLLFENSTLKKTEWLDIEKQLAPLQKVLNCLNNSPGKCLIAGGKIFNILFDQSVKSSDIDIFIYGCSEKEAEGKIVELYNYILTNYHTDDNTDDDNNENADDDNVNNPDDENIDNVNNATDENIDNVNNATDENIDNVNNADDENIDNATDENIDNVNNADDVDDTDDDIDEVNDENNHFLIGIPIMQPINSHTIVRTKNTISITNNFGKEYQIILRLYKTASEILHGFDVDSCSIAYDGENVLMTQRAIFSMLNGYNTVNFDRMSPSYELRLIKYAMRGMKIYIPNFDKKNIEYEKLSTYHEEVSSLNITRNRYKFHNNLKGIDKLLYFEYRLNKYNFNKKSIKSVNTISEEYSDYHTYKFDNRDRSGNSVQSILDWMVNTQESYLEYSKKYMPIINNMMTDFFEEHLKGLSESDRNIMLHIKKFLDDSNEKFNIKERFIRNGYYNPIRYILDKVLAIYENIFTTSIKHDNYTDNKIDIFMDTYINTLANSSFSYVRYKIWNPNMIKENINILNILLHIPKNCYDVLGIVKRWDFDADVVFKITNPGEQMTNTFNKIVYKNSIEWYKGNFYKI